MNVIEWVQKVFPWIIGLPLMPKILFSGIIVLVMGFILAIIWTSTDSPKKEEQSPEHKYAFLLTSQPSSHVSGTTEIIQRPNHIQAISTPKETIDIAKHATFTNSGGIELTRSDGLSFGISRGWTIAYLDEPFDID